MAVRQEAPVQRGPVIRTPERKTVKRIRKALIVGGAATGLAVAGLLGYEAIQPKQPTSEPTPIAGGIGEATPTPFITPEITIIPSPEVTPTPTPEITPSPTPEPLKKPWYERFPKMTNKEIEDIPIINNTQLEMIPYPKPPYFDLNVWNATVVAVVPNQDTNTLSFAITIAGDKITKDDCGLASINDSPTVKLCDFSGVTIWLYVKENTLINDATAQENPLGKGPETLAEYITVGKTLKRVGIPLGYIPNGIATEKQTKMNMNSYKKLNSSVGKSFPRSDDRFMFFSSLIDVFEK